MWLIFGVLAYVFIVGPKVFMLNNFCEGLGNMMQNFFKMSFYTEPFANKDFNGFPQWWTSFLLGLVGQLCFANGYLFCPDLPRTDRA